MSDRMGASSNGVGASTLPPCHPAAEIYPMMSDDEIADLAEDIKKKGQLVRVLMTDGVLLDGRNRWRACSLIGKEPIIREWDKQGDPLQVVESLNDKRRHYKPGQLAAIAAAKVAYYEVQAKEPVQEAGQRGAEGGRGRKKTPGVDSSPGVSGRDESKRSVAKAARETGAGVSATKAAKAIQEKAPEVFTELRDGNLTVEEAKRATALPEEQRKEVIDRVKAGEKPEEIKPPPKYRTEEEIEKDKEAIRSQEKPYDETLFGGESDDEQEAEPPASVTVPVDVPEHLQDLFGALPSYAQEMEAGLRQALRAFAKAEKKIMEASRQAGRMLFPQDELTALKRIYGPTGDVSTLIAGLRNLVPGGPCPQCRGQGCTYCHKTGWVNEQTVRDEQTRVKGREKKGWK